MAKVEHKLGPTGKTYCGRTITTNGDGRACKACAKVKWVESGKTYADIRAERETASALKDVFPGFNVVTSTIPTVKAELSVSERQDDLYERARFLGYTDESAARVADAFAEVWGIYDPCPTHPAHSTTIRDGYAVDSCEACDVIKLSDDKGYTLAGWQAEQAERKAENERLQAELDAFFATVALLVKRGCVRDSEKYATQAGFNWAHLEDAVTGRYAERRNGWIHIGPNAHQPTTTCEACEIADHGKCSVLICKCRCHGDATYKTAAHAHWALLVSQHSGTDEGKALIGRITHTIGNQHDTFRPGDAYFTACAVAFRGALVAQAHRDIMASESAEEIAARHKAEIFKVGDPYTFRNMVGYKLHQDRPFACRGVTCQCGKACHGTTVESVEILTDVALYVSGGLEIRGDKGSRAIIRADRLD